MKIPLATLAVTLAFFAVAPARAQAPEKTPAKSNEGFDRLKTLVGEWTAVDENGKPFSSTFRLVSNGTALEETFQTAQEDQMVTLYSPDGSRVALTHYCSVGNQPRMETPAIAGATDEFVFSFTGATNLASPDDSHMHRLVLQIDDADHISETWTFRAQGKDGKRTFNFVRKK
jgi:hypothetical protein